MVWDCNAAIRRVLVSQDYVTSSLVIEFVADSCKRFDYGLTRKDGQFAHMSITSSVMGGGTGSLCFLRLSRYA